MKVKLCPLCDSEMKKAHYCDVCKSFIWRPEILDIHYNAQERGMGEEDCAYGAEHDVKDHGADWHKKFSDVLKKNGEKTHDQRASSSHEEVYGTDAHNHQQKHDKWKVSGMDAEKNKRKAGGCLGKIVLAVIILNAIVSSVGSDIIHFFTESAGEKKIENVLDEFGIEDMMSILDDQSETDEELLAGTENIYSDADGISYFPVTKEELEEMLSAWTSTEYGSPIRKTSEDIEQECVYEEADGNEYTVPTRLSQYSMGKDQEFLMVYTGNEVDNILAIDASFRNLEHAYSFFSAISMTLDPDSDYDDSDWSDVLDDLLDQSADDFDEQQGSGHGSENIDNMTISLSKYADGELWLMFDAANDQ